jgi:hypothetical protein
MNDKTKTENTEVATENYIAPPTNEYDVEIEKLRLEQSLEIARWNLEESRALAALNHTLALVRENHKSSQRIWDNASSMLLVAALLYAIFGRSRQSHDSSRD